MQKKIILSLITINLFVLAMAYVIVNYSSEVTSQFSTLNQNQIRIYNPRGFTIEEMEAVKLLDNVTDVTFDNRNIFPHYILDFDNGSSLEISGISIEEDNQYQKSVDYLAGSYLTSKYQVIITQSLADVLIETGLADDYQHLIGMDMVNGLEIVGVYPDMPSTKERSYNRIYEQTDDITGFIKRQDVSITNGFMLFNRGAENNKAAQIIDYNLNVAYKYEAQNKDWDRYIYNYNDTDESNDEAEYQINYEESVANGAEGLIDPATTAYGKVFNDYAFINTDDNRDGVVEQLGQIFPEAAIVTSDTTFSSIQNPAYEWIKFGLVVIVLELFIFVPMFKNSKK